jgi:predicted TIM-barrel fold metal-dependent hydrolase
LQVVLGGSTNDFTNMPVIDAHVHLYPPEVNRDPAGWAAAHGEAQWALMCTRVRKASGQPVQGFPTLVELLRDLDKAGVDRAVLQGWYWENHANAISQNRFYAECVRAHPDRLSAFATVHPAAGREALDEMLRARDSGLIGLGELSPHAQGLGLDDTRWQAVLGLAGEWGWPVNLHVTDPNSRAYPGRVETPLVDFQALAKAFPQVKFILAHWGGRLWRAGGAWPANVWVDTAAAPLLYGAGCAIWSEGLQAVGAERVLWGTDYPLVLYPQNNGTETLTGFLAEAREHVNHEALSAILGGNAAQILKLI